MCWMIGSACMLWKVFNKLEYILYKDVGIHRFITLGNGDALKQKREKFKDRFGNVLGIHPLGCPTKRPKLLLSYVEFYPGEYDEKIKSQKIIPIEAKSWEEAEKR